MTKCARCGRKFEEGESVLTWNTLEQSWPICRLCHFAIQRILKEVPDFEPRFDFG